MTDRVLLMLPAQLVDRMRDLVAQGKFESVDACVEIALAGDPSSWAKKLPAHNHPTRVVLPEGECPGCDLHHQRQRQRDHEVVSAPIVCKCCGGRCKQQFRWRGTVRCGCPLEKGGAGSDPPRDIVQLDADLRGPGVV